MIILVINAGSSSLKYELFKNDGDIKSVYEGIIERIGLKGSVKNHEQALKSALEDLILKKIIKNLNEIDAVGHRVVHGGEKYKNSTKITPSVIDEIKRLCKLAPLHNPPNLAGIKAVGKHLKNITQVAVFDTAFHQNLDEKAYIYALPYNYYKKYGIRRYGFHGTSHLYVSKQVNKLLKKKNSKIITCHIGNGVSVTAVEDGKSIDTSMGFTPLEGLPMGTRCGDIDPAIVYKLMEKLKLDTKQIDNILNRKSGLKGLTGISSDMRDIWGAAKKNNKKAKFAISLLCYKIAKYIGAYSSSLRGLDAIAFTAGMGENAWYLREEICSYLPHLGVHLDNKKNRNNEIQIQNKKSSVKVFVIPTDEEKEIAIQTAGLLKK